MHLSFQGTKINKRVEDADTQQAVDNILSQLKGLDVKKETQIVPMEQVTPENLEQFVIDKASELINKSLTVLDEYQSVLTASPSEESAEAMAGLISAASSAIETLNRVMATNKKAATSIKLKEMDVASRKENNERDNATRLLMTRSEIMKMLTDAAKESHERVIDVEEVKVN